METERLYPIAAGDVTEIPGQVGGGVGHWSAVDEDPADNITSYVYNGGNTYKRDLYILTAPTGSGVIDHIVVTIRNRRASGTGHSKTLIKTGGVEVDGVENSFSGTWTTYTTTYTTNPHTSQPWTWEEITLLQAGHWLQGYNSNTMGTIVWVDVYFLPMPEVQTDPADNIGETTAKLHGTLLDDGGEACSVRFEYGVKPDLTEETAWQDGFITNDEFEALLVDLLPATTYVFRAIAENSAGQVVGETLEFTTESPPPPPPVYKKVLVTHPAIKEVMVLKDGEQQANYENLSNLSESRIETAIELPVETPATIVVTTLPGEQWTYQIS